MDNYWERFYKQKKAPTRHSRFTEEVEAFFIDLLGYDKMRSKRLNILDLGAGNGRDTRWFDKNYLFEACGIDKNYGIEGLGINKLMRGKVVKYNVNNIKSLGKMVDVVYSRFFLHSIKNKEILHLLDITPKYFVAEFRIKGDKPKLYPNHKRNLVDLGWLVSKILDRGFEILELRTGKGMAKYKNEDPLIARVYAKKI